MDSDTYGDHCWERPEDIDYIRQPIVSDSAPETAAEMAAALAASSMIFADDRDYAKKLVEEAVSLLYFAVDSGRCPSPMTEDQLYKSSGFNDEYLWASTLLYFATGNSTFLSLATDKEIATSAGAFRRSSKLRVFSWDNRLPGAALLLRRLRVFLNPGYPAEEMLSTYYGISGDNACSYLLQYGVFNYTRGGMIILDPHGHRHLQYVASAAYIASLFADYLRAEKLHGWYCGSEPISLYDLQHFARSQM